MEMPLKEEINFLLFFCFEWGIDIWCSRYQCKTSTQQIILAIIVIQDHLTKKTERILRSVISSRNKAIRLMGDISAFTVE